MATCGRHTCLERSIKFFLDQDYDNRCLLIYQNSSTYQELDDFEGKEKVILINNHLDKQTGQPYKTLGAIYRDTLEHVPSDTNVITFWDDDDIFIQRHVSGGVAGIKRVARRAYKPKFSYYRHSGGVQLVENTLEPSIFVDAQVIREQGFSDNTSPQHLKWVNWLIDNQEIVSDSNGEPTMCYNWGDNFFTFKTSGDPNNPSNFDNYRTHSQEHGDRVITPWTSEQVEPYYKMIVNKI
jgi:hypothetical protein